MKRAKLGPPGAAKFRLSCGSFPKKIPMLAATWRCLGWHKLKKVYLWTCKCVLETNFRWQRFCSRPVTDETDGKSNFTIIWALQCLHHFWSQFILLLIFCSFELIIQKSTRRFYQQLSLSLSRGSLCAQETLTLSSLFTCSDIILEQLSLCLQVVCLNIVQQV